MIRYARGNLLEAGTEALVNTVNCVGVMGKGIALQFKQAYPDAFEDYRRACDAGRMVVGRMHVFDRNSLVPPRYIIQFPTKRHWKHGSRMLDIVDGLRDLARTIRERGIASIAVPPLGCGNGGLDWAEVKPAIEAALADLDGVDVVVYEPGGAPANAAMPVNTPPPELTRGRAALLALFGRYLLPGYELCMLEAQKLAYFLSVVGEPLRLTFTKGRYGPYAEPLHHVLQRLEGHFIRGYGDRSRAATIALCPGALAAAEAFLGDRHRVTVERCERIAAMIDGFESPFGLELLSTVHWVANDPAEGAMDLHGAVREVHAWNDHKQRTFTARHIEVAWSRLREHGMLPAAPAGQQADDRPAV